MPGGNSILVIGAGAIGCAFAAAFRAAGFDVVLSDPDAASRERAEAAVARHIAAIGRADLPVADVPGALSVRSGAPWPAEPALVIEAGPEDAGVKAGIFADLLRTTPETTLLATASSALPISRILPERRHQRRCLVAHPANPPSLIRVVELVPGPGTEAATVDRTREILSKAGFAPVVLGAEIPAFVFNRLQAALLREAYRLVSEGVADVAGIDRLVRDGIGLRWALSGPFETADLNTAGGIRGHAARMGPAYAEIGADRGETDPCWPPDLVERVERARRAILPEDRLDARRAWREGALADLLAARRRILDADPGMP